MASPSRRALVAALDRFDRLLEIGCGDRLGVARDLVARGHDVVAVDVAVDGEHGVDRTADAGSLRVRHGDVVALADATDPASALGVGRGPGTGIDAVYARRLPAELQRPTVDLATRLEAACLFTTLGFEEPVVPVRRRSLPDTTLYVARTDTTRAP
ncbi:UPF0146 family protein [Halorubrum halodurans]|uniref:Uncharacterized protein n=1 Tax=Halorubrum halodurans TaxID=1383851 RepID=A0A256ISA0_9EURY|nr:UPF0146 family protein [Halorubrum halodurans]OYR59395.1 hypothetical protein DJ70_00510 [Halorubrum halodurans]